MPQRQGPQPHNLAHLEPHTCTQGGTPRSEPTDFPHVNNSASRPPAPDQKERHFQLSLKPLTFQFPPTPLRKKLRGHPHPTGSPLLFSFPSHSCHCCCFSHRSTSRPKHLDLLLRKCFSWPWSRLVKMGGSMDLEGGPSPSCHPPPPFKPKHNQAKQVKREHLSGPAAWGDLTGGPICLHADFPEASKARASGQGLGGA